MKTKPRGVRQAQTDLIQELRRLLDLAEPQVGIINKGLGGDGIITVATTDGHVYKISVKAVRHNYPRE